MAVNNLESWSWLTFLALCLTISSSWGQEFLSMNNTNITLYPNSRQVRQVRPFCSDPECQLTWTPVPNMGAALTGYNPIIGNSISGNRPDPGAKQQIFIPTFQRPDGRLDVHENIHFRDDVLCQLNTETKFVRSYQDYQSLKSDSWKLSESSSQGNSFNIPFLNLITNFESKRSSSESTSSDSQFETETTFFVEQNGEIYYNQAKCTIFRIDVSSFSKPEFHPSFKDAMRKLNRAAREPKEERSKQVLKAFISEFGTHYMSSAWLGATLTAETRFASKSANEGIRRERQNCIRESFGTAAGVGAKVREVGVSVNVPIGGGGAASEIGTTIGGWGANSDSTFNKGAEDCLKDDNNNRFYFENRFERTKITSVGSPPKADPEAWADDVRNSPAVVDRELKEISTLFTDEFIGDILEDDSNPSVGQLDPSRMKDFFNKGLASYCQLMLGEKGCGFTGLCRSNEICKNDNSELGFKCYKAPPSSTTTTSTEKPMRRGCTDTLVLSSTAGAAAHQGDSLGEYHRKGEWRGRSYWRQRGGFGILFYTEGNWVVSDEFEGDLIWLISNVDSEEPPVTGWHYWGNKEDFISDSTMTLSCGSLISCSRVILNIRGTWRSEGVYRPTTTWVSGRPVYQHSEEDLYLFVPERITHWSIRDNINDFVVSYRATNSPADPEAGTWAYHQDEDADHYNSDYDPDDYEVDYYGGGVSVNCE